jgi:poly(3-hydroxybutyrate) depolymerase
MQLQLALCGTLCLRVFAARKDACQDPLFWSGTQNVTISVDGRDRVFELYSPWQIRGECDADKYCTGPPLATTRGLVMNWHGCNAHLPLLDYHTEISKVTAEAADRGYFTITPLGTKTEYGEWGWNADGIHCASAGVDDFSLFEALFSFAQDSLCVDIKKVYTVGFSTGAFLSYGIACR